MLALVVSPKDPERIALKEVAEPSPQPNEAVVEVKAASLNRGEVRNLGTAAEGYRPGWDIAGVVAKAAADGSGPTAGTRVVGMRRNGGWGQRVPVPTDQLAAIPDAVSFEEASTLPVAGLTALRALAIGGQLLGRRVLITGASGGVGKFAVQLAKKGGAHVSALVRRQERAEGAKELGADEVLMNLTAEGPKFDLVLESVGGKDLAMALQRMNPHGTIVTFGCSSGEPTTFDVRMFYPHSGARLQAFLLFPDLERDHGGGRDLGFLASMVAAKVLDPEIEHVFSWREAAKGIAAVRDRTTEGKVVLRFD